MKIRLTGTRAETDMTARLLEIMLRAHNGPARFRVREVSEFYPNRGNSELGRVYIDVNVELADATGGDAS